MCPSDPLETWTRNAHNASAERIAFVRRYVETHRERDQWADDERDAEQARLDAERCGRPDDFSPAERHGS